MKFTQHVPGAVDMDEKDRVAFEFEKKEELIEHEYVKRFTDPKTNRTFHRLSLESPKLPYGTPRYCLMAEYDEGRRWWVLGFIEGTNEEIATLELPKWKPVRA